MTPLPPDRSRDRRIEDPTNLWIVHPAGRRLLPWFVARGISANAVSVGGLLLGGLAAAGYMQWHQPVFVVAGLALSVGWLIADGLDGMIARATGTASPLGRALDGLCDHGVFALVYLGLAISIGTLAAWCLAAAAGVAHAVQSALFEKERARFHRRCRAVAAAPMAASDNPLVQLYDRVAALLDSYAAAFDELLARAPRPAALAEAYAERATAPMRLMSLLSANVRVLAIFLACLAGNPRLFWWFELGPLTAILLVGLFWNRNVERGFTQQLAAIAPEPTIRSVRTRRM